MNILAWFLHAIIILRFTPSHHHQNRYQHQRIQANLSSPHPSLSSCPSHPHLSCLDVIIMPINTLFHYHADPHPLFSHPHIPVFNTLFLILIPRLPLLRRPHDIIDPPSLYLSLIHVPAWRRGSNRVSHSFRFSTGRCWLLQQNRDVKSRTDHWVTIILMDIILMDIIWFSVHIVVSHHHRPLWAIIGHSLFNHHQKLPIEKWSKYVLVTLLSLFTCPLNKSKIFCMVMNHD